MYVVYTCTVPIPYRTSVLYNVYILQYNYIIVLSYCTWLRRPPDARFSEAGLVGLSDGEECIKDGINPPRVLCRSP